MTPSPTGSVASDDERLYEEGMVTFVPNEVIDASAPLLSIS